MKSKLTCNPLVEYTFKLCAAAAYVVLMKQPSISSLFPSKSQKQFFLNCLYNCQRVAAYYAWDNNTPTGIIAAGLTYTAKVINHSCDPNAMAFYDADRVKCILIRPVRKGEQITYSLGPAWFNPGGQSVSELSFKCRCPVCRFGSPQEWMSLGKPLPPNARNDLGMCMAVLISDTGNDAAKLNAFQQIIQRYDSFLPNMDLSLHLRIYTEKLKDAIVNENVKLNRAKGCPTRLKYLQDLKAKKKTSPAGRSNAPKVSVVPAPAPRPLGGDLSQLLGSIANPGVSYSQAVQGQPESSTLFTVEEFMCLASELFTRLSNCQSKAMQFLALSELIIKFVYNGQP
ncbi:hypothetical protein pipiens_015134 [Culex pipiens pipiens]|uniref:SET domain-containing protein n=1 Tax=Culex pipiens pipiens TaxID=38569 RepID=A0ABD1CSV4_CULPP